MYYRTQLKDYVRVSPKNFSEDIEQSVLKSIKEKYDGYIDPDVGIVIDVLSIADIKDGVVITGDGAAYYDTNFEVMAFKPEAQEVVMGRIKDIADFGAFLTLGPLDGMVHISQTMDDFVSFAKEKVLTGKETNRTLKIGDQCRARIITVSFKDVSNPKLGLTMRQEGLGKVEWLDESKA